MKAIFIQARLKSTRLKKKVLLDYKGLSIIEYQINRLKKQLDIPIVLLTSTNNDDIPLLDISKKNDILYFAGSEDDVINRFYSCASTLRITSFYLIFGDEPFTATSVIEKTFNDLNNTNNLIISNVGLPEGTYGYGLSYATAKKLEENKTSADNEVWGKMAEEIGIQVSKPFENNNNQDIRLTIDYPEDFEVFKKIIDIIGDEYLNISLEELISIYNKNELYKTNGFRIREYKGRLASQSK